MKYFFIIFLYTKVTNKYYQKYKEKPSKKALEKYQNLSEEKKTKCTDMLLSDIEIFLNRKKKRSVEMVGNELKIF